MKRLSLLVSMIFLGGFAWPATAQREGRPYYQYETTRYERDPYADPRANDRVLHDEVHAALEQALGEDAHDIRVSVRRGRVVLSGTVVDPEARTLAHDIAHEVPGVRSVSYARLHTARWR